MAVNLYQYEGRCITGAATAPATPTSGDACIIGQIPGVALTDEGDGGNATGEITMDTGGIYNLPVVGETTSASAIAVGDILYYDATKVNADDTNGVRFGYALGAVASGATTTIPVKVGW